MSKSDETHAEGLLKQLFNNDGTVNKPKNIFAPRPEQLVEAVVSKWSHEKQKLFERVLDSLQSQMQGIPDTQLAMAAVSYVNWQDWADISPSEARTMGKDQSQMYEFARKAYDSNFNAVISQAQTRIQEDNFLDTLKKYLATKEQAPELVMKTKYKSMNLALPPPKREEANKETIEPTKEKEELLKRLEMPKKPDDDKDFIGIG